MTRDLDICCDLMAIRQTVCLINNRAGQKLTGSKLSQRSCCSGEQAQTPVSLTLPMAELLTKDVKG
ncbi:MAG: hypothetical protein WCO00_02300 [Rhodospirillaceae bacterium]